MSTITKTEATRIFVVDAVSASMPPSVDNRIAYDKSDKKLKIYNKKQTSWISLLSDSVIYAENDEALADITGSFTGQIGIAGAEEKLYFWNGATWASIGGSGSVTIADDEEAVALLPGELGSLAIASDKNILWYYNGTDWVSTQEKINIPYVYVNAGNITTGTVITNKTNQEMWELLLTKELYPTINQPSVSFSMSGASNNSLQEIGAQLNLTFTANFNQGNVRNTWGSNDYQSSVYSGVPNTYNFTGTGLTPSVSSTSLSNQQTVNPYKVVDGDQTWTVSVAFDAGTYQPVSNYGNNYGTTCAAGSKSGNTLKLTGVYPTYASSVNLTTATKQTLVRQPANNSSYLTFKLAGESSTAERQFFELPASWSQLTGVADSGGAWYNGGKTGSVTQWTVSDVTETVQGEVINYKRYTYNGPLSAIRTIRVFTK